MTTELSLSNQEQLIFDAQERIISEGLATFRDVGIALMTIADGRLYRANFNTFADYCKARWGFSVSTAYNRIKAVRDAEVRDVPQIESSVPTNPTISPESEPDDDDGPPDEPEDDGPPAEEPVVVQNDATSGPPEKSMDDELAKVFRIGAVEMDDILTELRSIQSRVRRIRGTRAGAYLVPQVETDIKNAIHAIEFAIPHSPTPPHITRGKFATIGFITKAHIKEIEKQ